MSNRKFNAKTDINEIINLLLSLSIINSNFVAKFHQMLTNNIPRGSSATCMHFINDTESLHNLIVLEIFIVNSSKLSELNKLLIL